MKKLLLFGAFVSSFGLLSAHDHHVLREFTKEDLIKLVIVPLSEQKNFYKEKTECLEAELAQLKHTLHKDHKVHALAQKINDIENALARFFNK